MRIIIFTYYLDEESSQKVRSCLVFISAIRDVKRLTSHSNKSLLLTLSTAQRNEKQLVAFFEPARITNVDFMWIERWVWCVYAFELIVLSLILRILYFFLLPFSRCNRKSKRITFLINKCFQQPIVGDSEKGRERPRFIFMKLELLSCLVVRVV